MSCRRIRKRLAAYQDGEIGGKERERISAHLEGCPACRSAYAELDQVWQALGKIPEIRVSGRFERRLFSKIHTAADPHSQRRFPSLFQWFPAPAMALGVVLIGIALGAYMGNLLVGSDSRPVLSQAGYSQAGMDIHSFKAFAAVPPGTLGDGYLRMVHFTEDRRK
jgi:anti-sigma factor RsiW